MSRGRKARWDACRIGTSGEGMPLNRKYDRKVGQSAPRAARGAALALLAVLAGTAVARAGDADNSPSTMGSDPSFYDKMLQTIGVEGGPNIQYSERSPLVVPPTRDLPPPMADRPPPVAGWPVDPDLTQKVKAKEKQKPKPHKDYVIESSRPLSPAELNVPGAAPAPERRDPRADPEAQDLSPAATQPNKPSVFSPSNFGKIFGKGEEYATFTGEPARSSLTDPPPGYLTPSPDQPYGVGPEQKKYKIPTVADRATPTSGTAGGN
jgi:hypothetical protein